MTLPEWDIEQERYWQVATVNSVLEYIVYSCALVEEKFQDILFWKSLSVFICEKSMIWCALQLKKYFKIFRFGKFCLFSFVRRVWFDALPVVGWNVLIDGVNCRLNLIDYLSMKYIKQNSIAAPSNNVYIYWRDSVRGKNWTH